MRSIILIAIIILFCRSQFNLSLHKLSDRMSNILSQNHPAPEHSVYITVQQKYLTIWQHNCEWNCWCGEFIFERPYSETQSISVAMKRWSVEHWAFAVETYFKNNNSVVLTQWICLRHFNIHWNNSVSSRNTLLLWVRNFRETASAAKRKPPGRELSLRTPENIKRVRQVLSEILDDQVAEMPLH